MTEVAEAALARAHQALTVDAESSKRAISANRRRLAEQKAAIAAIEAEAERLGMTFHIEGKDPRRPKP
jgi:hypothetical protein